MGMNNLCCDQKEKKEKKEGKMSQFNTFLADYYLSRNTIMNTVLMVRQQCLLISYNVVQFNKKL